MLQELEPAVLSQAGRGALTPAKLCFVMSSAQPTNVVQRFPWDAGNQAPIVYVVSAFEVSAETQTQRIRLNTQSQMPPLIYFMKDIGLFCVCAHKLPRAGF